MPPGILIISPFYPPNIGGVETHLDDLVAELIRLKYHVYVLTYSPLTTSVAYQARETRRHLYIRRYRWFGGRLFPLLENYSFLNFLYLTPYLFIRTLVWMIVHHRQIKLIHSHGFNAAAIGVVISALFSKRHLTSTHAVYTNISGISRLLVTMVLNRCHHIFCLSQKSAQQLIKWHVNHKKISLYTYWVNLKRFHPSPKPPPKFTFLFVGRLLSKKGVRFFLRLSKKLPQFQFIVVGTGPLEKSVSAFAANSANLRYLGFLTGKALAGIYRRSSLLCVPSLYPEGFGRVTIEAIASGLPVIATNLGGLPEAVNSDVAILFPPKFTSLLSAAKKVSSPRTYQHLRRNCRRFAQEKYSSKNCLNIVKFY